MPPAQKLHMAASTATAAVVVGKGAASVVAGLTGAATVVAGSTGAAVVVAGSTLAGGGQQIGLAMSTVPHMTSDAASVDAYPWAVPQVVPSLVRRTREGLAMPPAQKLHKAAASATAAMLMLGLIIDMLVDMLMDMLVDMLMDMLMDILMDILIDRDEDMEVEAAGAGASSWSFCSCRCWTAPQPTSLPFNTRSTRDCLRTTPDADAKQSGRRAVSEMILMIRIVTAELCSLERGARVFFFTESTVNRLEAMVNIIPHWIRKDV
jgi:hypothetical protein